MQIKILPTLFLCLFSFSCYARGQEPDELASIPPKREDAQSSQKAEGAIAKSVKAKIETSSISISKRNGCHYHVADYRQGDILVVTCLDGNMKGHQVMYINGVATAQSSNVKWHSKYHFVHKYPDAQVTSYEHKQIVEIK
jgi:hypothetical protein